VSADVYFIGLHVGKIISRFNNWSIAKNVDFVLNILFYSPCFSPFLCDFTQPFFFSFPCLES
jgi:hypothetical protein